MKEMKIHKYMDGNLFGFITATNVLPALPN